MKSTHRTPAAEIAVLERVAEAWNHAGIDYAVCHGIEGYPESVGRDLDVILRRSQRREAMSVAIDVLRGEGFLVVVPGNPWGARWLFAFRGEIRLEIDLIPHLFRGPALFVPNPRPVGRVGPFKADPWASFVKRVLMPLLGGGPPKQPFLAPGEEREAPARCERLFGRNLTQELFHNLRTRDLPALLELAPRLKVSSARRGLVLRPLRAAALFVPWLRKSVSPALYRCAPIVALVGPDGAGKSTALRAMQNQPPAPFSGTMNRHWRPGLLPRPGALLGRPGPVPGADGLLPPRREPGKLHWLRLTYYFVDFVLGHFLKDRADSSKLQIVLYDRHALDMVVDPVRYGLSSARGARLLWRLIPKPDLVILLFDDPRRIRERKPELEVPEIERQLRLWLRLAQEGEVGAVVPTTEGPERTAQALRELILEAFIRNRRRAVDRRPSGLLVSVLSDLGLSPGTVFGRIGLRDGREYLLPMGFRRAARSGLGLYRPQNPGAGLLKKLLLAGVACGVGRLLLPAVRVGTEGTGSGAKAAGSLLDYLRQNLGCGGLTAAVYLGMPGPVRKPVYLLMSSTGRPIGYAKVGWNEQTRLLVERETRALEHLGNCRFEAGVFPPILHRGNWQGKTILVTGPVALGGESGVVRALQDLHVKFLLELAAKGRQVETYGNSGFLSMLRTRIDTLRGRLCEYKRQLIDFAMDLLVRDLGSEELPWVWRTGDFVPWNLGVDRANGRIVAVDLEFAEPDSLPGWDLFHFLSRTATGPGQGIGLPGSPTHAISSDYFRVLGIAPSLIPSLQAAYLLDLWTMMEELWMVSQSHPTGEAVAWMMRMAAQLSVITAQPGGPA